jgi:hypothetical protein
MFLLEAGISDTATDRSLSGTTLSPRIQFVRLLYGNKKISNRHIEMFRNVSITVGNGKMSEGWEKSHMHIYNFGTKTWKEETSWKT